MAYGQFRITGAAEHFAHDGCHDGTAADPIVPVVAIDGTVAVSGGATQYAEDTAHASGHYGTMPLAVRRDSPAVGSGSDGDYSTLNVDSLGRLYTQANRPGVQVHNGCCTSSSGNVDILYSPGSGCHYHLDVVTVGNDCDTPNAYQLFFGSNYGPAFSLPARGSIAIPFNGLVLGDNEGVAICICSGNSYTFYGASGMVGDH